MSALKKKPGAAWAGATGRKKLLMAEYRALDLLQARTVWAVWRREAERLFADYWRTGDLKHLCAFVRHIHAMRAHEGLAK
jgi:hypothetical protein